MYYLKYIHIHLPTHTQTLSLTSPLSLSPSLINVRSFFLLSRTLFGLFIQLDLAAHPPYSSQTASIPGSRIISEILIKLMKSFRYEKGIYKCPQTATDTIITYFKNPIWDFPGGTVDKNLSANARDTDLIPGLGRLHVPWSN